MTMLLVLVATAISVLILLALCLSDPKRKRAAGMRETGQTGRLRQVLTAAACLPGLLCALIGDAAAFLIWLGGCGVIGWSLAIWFSRGAQERN